MLAGTVTSRAIRVTLGSFSRFDILDRLRAVANTWRPRSWKASASAAPMPPALQPVMRTDLGAMGFE